MPFNAFAPAGGQGAFDCMAFSLGAAATPLRMTAVDVENSGHSCGARGGRKHPPYFACFVSADSSIPRSGFGSGLERPLNASSYTQNLPRHAGCPIQARFWLG